MYQILVTKENLKYVKKYRKEERYYQEPNFERTFNKLIDLASEVFRDASREQIESCLLRLFEEGQSKVLPMKIENKKHKKQTIVINSNERRYSITIVEYHNGRGI